MTRADEIAALIALQQDAVRAMLPPSAEARRDVLLRFRRMLARNADELAAAIDHDFGGRDRTFSQMNDVLACIMSLDTSRKRLHKWMKPSSRSSAPPFSLFGAKARVTPRPRGVVAIIGSWNAPVYTLVAPLSSAIAAGNRVILKPSEFAPSTGALLASLVAAEFAAEDIAVVNGGADVAQELVGGAVDLIVFTGGSGTGRKVMERAARRLTPVILELGGKSPVIISRSADVRQAAHRIAIGKGANSGQLCISPDTIYLPREQVDAFSQALQEEYRTLYGAMGSTAAIVNEAHCERFEGLLADARLHSRSVVSLPEAPDGTRRRPFSVVIDPKPEARISNEEVFGPAVVVRGYDRFEALVDELAREEKPLALYYFGTDRSEERLVFDRLPSGGASVNDVLMHASAFDAPFGGVGRSGMGHFHGREGFDAMSHMRTIFRGGWWDPRKALGMLPPYSDKMRKMIEQTVAKAAR